MSLLANDPLTQLAFSIYENKGVYALLLGSGLSRTAEIPTGWEITLDLIRRIALAKGVNEQADWAQWYRDETGLEPNYSTLLETMSASPDERRSILHSYIEPTAEERDEGKKVPTPAHLAIAELVKDGFIRVIVTTNFDRLMENALREKGVEPTIIGSVDALKGAEPLIHSRCYVLKLHGDYKDARILNTDEELSQYPPEYERLLDSIFDDHGLIVAGWSGEWDHALRAALLRVASRRYSVFWATRGQLGTGGEELIGHRRAKTITIRDADSFFAGLLERVKTLGQTQTQNPLSVELAVATTKRYLSKPEFRIQLSDLFESETNRLLAAIAEPRFAPQGSWSPQEFQQRVARYESATESLAKMAGVLGRWGDGSDIKFIADIIRTIYAQSQPQTGGLTVWLNIRTYPAVLIFVAYGIGLVRAGRWKAFASFMAAELPVGQSKATHRFVEALWLWDWVGDDKNVWNQLEGFGKRHTPLSDHLLSVFTLWEPSVAGLSAGFEVLFERFEVMSSLAYLNSKTENDLQLELSTGDNSGKARMPIGRSGWHTEVRDQLFEELRSPRLKAELKNAGLIPSEPYIDLFITNYSRIIKVLGYSWF